MLRTNFIATTHSDVDIIRNFLKKNKIAFSTNDLEVTLFTDFDDTNNILDGFLVLIDNPIYFLNQREFSCSRIVVYYDLEKYELYDNAMVFLEVKFKASSHADLNTLCSTLKSLHIPYSLDHFIITYYTDRIAFVEIQNLLTLIIKKNPEYLSIIRYKSCHSHYYLILENNTKHYDVVKALPYVFTWRGHKPGVQDRFEIEILIPTLFKNTVSEDTRIESGTSSFNLQLNLKDEICVLKIFKDDDYIQIDVVTMENHLKSLST